RDVPHHPLPVAPRLHAPDAVPEALLIERGGGGRPPPPGRPGPGRVVATGAHKARVRTPVDYPLRPTYAPMTPITRSSPVTTSAHPRRARGPGGSAGSTVTD